MQPIDESLANLLFGEADYHLFQKNTVSVTEPEGGNGKK